jgi:hypothetical protein
LSTSCVIFSYPKLLSISVLTFIKWRLTPSSATKDTIFWPKKKQNYRYQNYFISESVKVHFLPRVDTFSFTQEPRVVYCF